MLEKWMEFSSKREDESGFSTAELLANVAIAVVALIFIWGLIRTDLAPAIINFIRDRVLNTT